MQGRAISNWEELVLPPIKLPGGDEVTPAEREVLRALADLVLHCTKFNPDDRPTMAQILQARLIHTILLFSLPHCHISGVRTGKCTLLVLCCTVFYPDDLPDDCPTIHEWMDG